MKKILLIAAMLLLVGAGCGSKPEVTLENIGEFDNVNYNEQFYRAELTDVTKGKRIAGVLNTDGQAGGTAILRFEPARVANNGYDLRVSFTKLPPAPEGYYYAGWLRKGRFGDPIRTGRLTDEEGSMRNLFLASADYTDYDHYEVTLEPEPENESASASKNVVMRGEFAPATLSIASFDFKDCLDAGYPFVDDSCLAHGRTIQLTSTLPNEEMKTFTDTGLAREYSRAKLSTSMGDITVEFYGQDAPQTVTNFLTLAQEGFYNGVRFHRVIPDFMIQTGDPQTKDPEVNRAFHGTGGPGYRFVDEINKRKLVRGSLAMANAGPDTNGSQFFIVVATSTPWLDGAHTNFGTVVEGMDVVDKIALSPRDGRDNPYEPIAIERIELLR